MANGAWNAKDGGIWGNFSLGNIRAFQQGEATHPWLLTMLQEKAERNFRLTCLPENTLNLVTHVFPLLGSDRHYRGILTSFEIVTALKHHQEELSKANDAADESNQGKREYPARMSHEIRTPMSAILGYTEVLRLGLVESEQQREEHLTTSQNSEEHLLALTNDILDILK